MTSSDVASGKLSADYCSMLKVRAASIEHLEGVIERIGRHGEMWTSIVLSTQFADRPVQPAQTEFLRASASQGWNQSADMEAMPNERSGRKRKRR